LDNLSPDPTTIKKVVQEISLLAEFQVGFLIRLLIETGKSRGITLWRGFGGVPHLSFKSPYIPL
jgi:hypothetical protein